MSSFWGAKLIGGAWQDDGTIFGHSVTLLASREPPKRAAFSHPIPKDPPKALPMMAQEERQTGAAEAA